MLPVGDVGGHVNGGFAGRSGRSLQQQHLSLCGSKTDPRGGKPSFAAPGTNVRNAQSCHGVFAVAELGHRAQSAFT